MPSSVSRCWWEASVLRLRGARLPDGHGSPGSARADRSFTRPLGRPGPRPVTRNRTAGMVPVNQEPGGGGQQAAACHPGQYRHLMSCYDINIPAMAINANTGRWLAAPSGVPGCWWPATVPTLPGVRVSRRPGGHEWPGSGRADRSFTRQWGRPGPRPVSRNRTAGMVPVNQEPGGGQPAAACHPGQRRHTMSCYDINGRQPGLASPWPAHAEKPGCQSGCAPC